LNMRFDIAWVCSVSVFDPWHWPFTSNLLFLSLVLFSYISQLKYRVLAKFILQLNSFFLL
jgi:hypothetical protein